MDVNWEEAIQRWRGLNLSALYLAEDIHNRSLALISSVISQKLDDALQTPTSSTFASTFLTTTAVITGSTPHRTQVVDAVTQSLESATCTNPVSWQIAFWTLVVIASNTCLQDCGRICGIDKGFALLVRSSPFICLADTWVVLLQSSFFALTKGPKSAIQIVALSRDQHSHITHEGLGPAWYIARGIFVTLAVIQSVKLFALSGMPWTQFFGACYLSSYFVNAVLNVFGRPLPGVGAVDIPRTGSVILDRKIVTQAANLAVIAQLIAWTVSLAQALPSSGLWSWGTCGDILHGIAIIYMMIPILAIFTTIFTALLVADLTTVLGPAGILVYLCYTHLRHEWPSFIELTAAIINVTDDTAAVGIGIVSASTSLVLHVCFYPFSALNAVMDPLMDTYSPKIVRFMEEWHSYGLVLVFISTSAFLSHLVTRVLLFGTLATRLHLRHLRIASNEGSAYLFLFVANVAFALIYFTVAYDSDNTNKPGWTDNLGRFLL